MSVSPPDAKEMDCMWWLAMIWRVAGTERLRPSVEMLTAILMPAKRRLLLPRMEASALLGAFFFQEPRTPGTAS